MKLLIGLGNPGEHYARNRHSAGKLLVKKMKEMGNPGDIRAMESESLMNDSGKFVAQLYNFYKITPDDLCIAHDDLDIPLGQYKIQKGIGPKVHYGVNSIEEALGTKDFWRIRIGIDNRNSQNRIPGEEYVLQNFTDEELVILDKVFDAIIKDGFK
ncbi:aminoacyl-tRNA hydrolase [Patescibacteria group bacterium]|nr:aminoacyl-tRNA hydrolase [Patescibacteria group bacterium]